MGKGKMMEAIVSISGQVSPDLQKSVKQSVRTIKGFKSNVKKTATLMSKSFAIGAGAATMAVGAFSGAALHNGAEMQKEMSNVATLLDGTAEQVDARIAKLGKGVIKVSNNTGKATSDLTDGLYQVISAMGDSKDSVANLQIAAKAATAGNATTTDSINLLSAVTKGYGDTSKKAVQKASDLAFQTVKLGQTSFPELAASIGKVTPLASALGMTQEELFGATATLTGVTGGTAEVMTQMKAVLSGMMSPSEDMAKMLEKIGYSSGSMAMESLGLNGTLEALGKAVGGDTQKLAKLFSSVEAQTAVLSLAGSQSKNFTDKTKQMYDSLNATDTAFERQTDNIDYQIQSIKNLGSNFLTSIGMEALPEVEKLAKEALPMITESLDLIAPDVSEVATSFTQNILPLTTDLLPVLVTGIKNCLPAITDVSQIAVPLITDVVTAATPIISTILPEAATRIADVTRFLMQNKEEVLIAASVIGGLVVSYKAMTAIMGVYNTVAPIVTALTSAERIAQAKLTAQAAISKAGTIASTVANGAYTVSTGIATAATTAFGVAFKVATGPIGWIITAIGALIAVVVLVVKNFDKVKATALKLWDTMKKVGSGIKEAFVTAFGALVGVVAAPINGIVSIVNGVVSKINAIKINIPDWIPKPFGGQTFSLNIPLLPTFAKGGFTDGISIAGEEAVEAIISFDTSVRKQNIGYWLDAGKRLGVDFDTIYNTFGREDGKSRGVTSSNMTISYSPTIIIQGNANKSDVDKALKESQEEFFDRCDDWWNNKNGGGDFDVAY